MLADWFSRSLPDKDFFDDDKETEVPVFNLVNNEEIQLIVKPMSNSEKYLLQKECIIPFIPSYSQIREETVKLTDNPESNKYTYIGKDLVRYSVKSHKLLIPLKYRIHFIYWMHASRYGGHAGINRTTNRLKKWVWWPSLKKSVSDFI